MKPYLTKGILGNINDGVRAIATNMAQYWIREINHDFGRATRGYLLGDLLHDVPFFMKYNYKVHEIDFLKL